MDDLTIRIDGKVVLDSQGHTIKKAYTKELIELVFNGILRDADSHQIVVTVKSVSKTQGEQQPLIPTTL